MTDEIIDNVNNIILRVEMLVKDEKLPLIVAKGVSREAILLLLTECMM